MRRLVFIAVLTIVCLQSLYGNPYTFSVNSAPITEISLPWTRQGDTVRMIVSVRNESQSAHAITLALSAEQASLTKNDGPVYFEVGTQYIDSIRVDLGPQEKKEFTLIHIPARFNAGRFHRYLHLFEDHASKASTVLPIDVRSAFTFYSDHFSESFLARMIDLPVQATECLPVYFKNQSPNAEVLTEFLSVNLPNWITVENKFTLPVVTLPGEVLYFSDICITPPEPNMERLEGPIYLIHKQENVSKTRDIQLHITSKTDTNLLRTCVELSTDSVLFGPIDLGMQTTQNVRVKSNRAYPIRLTSASFEWGDVEGFTFNSSIFPLLIEPFGEVTIPVTFSPTTTDPAVKRRYAVGFSVYAVSDSTSCEPDITLTGLCGTLGVADEESFVSLQISPNPTRNWVAVRVEDLRDVTIEVADVLGAVIVYGSGPEFEFSASGHSTLIVRVEGTDITGKRRVLSRRLVVLD